jgi:hypothetical protein
MGGGPPLGYDVDNRRLVRNEPEAKQYASGIDIDTCPACGGAVRIIACIEDPEFIEKIVAHLDAKGAELELSRLPPCRAPPQWGVRLSGSPNDGTGLRRQRRGDGVDCPESPED